MTVIALGEGLIRYSVPPGQRLETAPTYDVYVGGSELNTLIALAGLGIGCRWLTTLPDDPLGRRIVRGARAAGVSVDAQTAPGRTGVYYYQPGTGGLPAQVTYDRAGSAFSLTPPLVDSAALTDARWLHLTGITAALSLACLDSIMRACAAARAAGMHISFDVNYRATLWMPEAARAALLPVLALCDVVLCAARDAETVFGAPDTPALAALTGAPLIVCSAGDAGITAWHAGRTFYQPAHSVIVVDRVGAGDALAAGVIYGLLTTAEADSARVPHALACGAALAALKLGQHGDHLTVTRDELDLFLQQGMGGQGSIQR